MNPQYANHFAHFMCCNDFHFHGDTIRIPLEMKKNIRDAFIKMRALKHRHIKCNRPLAKALQAYFRTERVVTACYDDVDWCVLVGDKLLTPGKRKKLLLNVTPYFMQKAQLSAFHDVVVRLKSIPYRDGLYLFQNCVLFLDEYSIPYPGGTYFSESNVASPTWYRLCYLGDELDVVIPIKEHFHLNVLYKYRTVETTLSPFLTLSTDDKLPHAKSFYNSKMVKQNDCHSDPAFILQDIIKSYGKLNNVGLIVEAPIRISFVPQQVSREQRYYYFAINCILPDRCLVVSRPYERIFEYTQAPEGYTAWTTVLYDPEYPPEGVSSVIWDGTEIGYGIKNTFFCLSSAKLRNLVKKKWMNLNHIFRKLSFDIHGDRSFSVLNKTLFDNDHVVYTVRYQALNFDLWCLSEENGKEMSFKRDHIPSLVSSWIHLVLSTRDASLPTCSLDLQKMLYIMVKHGMCFRMIQVKDGEEERFDFDGNVVIFYVCKDVIQYTNGQRLLSDDINSQITNKEADPSEDGCIIM